MTRFRNSAIGAALVATALLSACGGVDREKSIDNFMKGYADLGVEIDRDCVKGVFDQYNDDELKAVSNADLTIAVESACLASAGGGEEAPAEGGEEAPEDGG